VKIVQQFELGVKVHVQEEAKAFLSLVGLHRIGYMCRKRNIVKASSIRVKVEINWNPINMMNRSYDIVDATLVNFQKPRQALNVESRYVFGLETNKESERRGIDIAEAMSFIQEGFKLCHQALNGGIVLRES
jgi:hypothetical protein